MADKIMLVVKDQARKESYLKLLGGFPVCWSIVGSLKDAINLASESPHSGILIDLPLMVRAPQAIKVGIDDLLDGLPSGTLNIHAANGELRLLTRGDRSLQCASIEEFIVVCAEFSPKLIFSRHRVRLHYNALFATTPDLCDPERTVCMDISTGGCFLICLRPPDNGDIAVQSTIWVKLIGLNNDNPIEALVRWVREWGTSHNIPGMGVEFQNVSDELRAQIAVITRY